MRGSGRFILGLAAVVGFFALYVHINVSLFTVSYAIDRRGGLLGEREQMQRYLQYEVERLRSPYRLNEMIKEHDMELDIPKDIRVIQVPVPEMLPVDALTQAAPDVVGGGLMDFLGQWVPVAQAGTDSK